MPVTPTYPGLYIEELPFNSNAVQAAPTSIAAFIGYVNPWYTSSSNGAGFNPPPGGAGTNASAATVLYSFTDYETNFGGMFTSGLVDASLPRAVYQFFANGGSQAYVVGLEPQLYSGTGTALGTFSGSGSTVAAFTATVPGITQGSTAANLGLVFTAQQFTDLVPMTLIVSNLRAGVGTALDTFDVEILYGTTIETYRGVTIGASAAANPKTAAWTVINAASVLVTLAPGNSSLNLAGYGSALLPPTTPPASVYPFTCSLLQPTPSGAFAQFASCFSAADFLPQLAANTTLDQLEIFNLLLVPGIADNSVQSAALAFAEYKRAFALLDPPQTATITGKEAGLTIDSFASTMPRSQNGAIYFPWLNGTDSVTGNPIQVSPSGYVAGICAKTDVARGVWKAPAGMATALLNTSGPAAGGIVTDAQHGELNIDQAVNCLRQFASIGTVVFGSRTLVGNNNAYAQSKYVPVRRMTLFLEQTLLANLRWVVFEPNDTPLWTAIKLSIESFLLGLWNQGALQGATPSQAFQVKCDSSTTTPADQQNGIVNIVVAFAPLKPAEFVVIQISQLAGQAVG
jgi:phage tail sheath protein FI